MQDKFHTIDVYHRNTDSLDRLPVYCVSPVGFVGSCAMVHYLTVPNAGRLTPMFYNRDSCMRAAVCNAGSGWQCPLVLGI